MRLVRRNQWIDQKQLKTLPSRALLSVAIVVRKLASSSIRLAPQKIMQYSLSDSGFEEISINKARKLYRGKRNAPNGKRELSDWPENSTESRKILPTLLGKNAAQMNAHWLEGLSFQKSHIQEKSNALTDSLVDHGTTNQTVLVTPHSLRFLKCQRSLRYKFGEIIWKNNYVSVM